MSVEISIYGVRGSSPISHPDFIKYGGNTASFTIRTPLNSLIFLDAGTGLRFASAELDKIAERVWLAISHTHADHVFGLGMSSLPNLSSIAGYEETKLKIMGPKGVIKGLQAFYDGDIVWPVKLSNELGNGPNMPGIDLGSSIEFTNGNCETNIDDGCKVEVMTGNHPVRNGVLLYKFTITEEEREKIIVYSTDNEFDFLTGPVTNSDADKLKNNFVNFVRKADVVLADAQYTNQDYQTYRGFGHSYPEQILDLCAKAEVKRVIFIHHHSYNDRILDLRELEAKEYSKQNGLNLEVEFGKEGTKFAI